MIANLLAAVMIGFASSAHCLFMCGGISAAFTAASDLETRRQYVLGLAFQVGRIFSYGIIGVLLGTLVISAGQVSGLGLLLRILAGLLLVGMGLYLTNIWRGLALLEKPLAPLWKKLSARASRLLPVRRMSHALIIGALWGWLPCGLVYSTLAWATTASSTSWESGLLMMAMGLGTLPAMLGIGFFSRLLGKKATRMAAGILLCLFGVWTIWMPAQSVFSNNMTHEDHGAPMHIGH